MTLYFPIISMKQLSFAVNLDGGSSNQRIAEVNEAKPDQH